LHWRRFAFVFSVFVCLFASFFLLLLCLLSLSSSSSLLSSSLHLHFFFCFLFLFSLFFFFSFSFLPFPAVDHGKSTIAGFLCDLPEKQLKEYEKAAKKIGKQDYKFAWIMDKLKEERELGTTIVSKTWIIKTQNYDIDLIDCPGHRRYMKNMACGASLADVCFLFGLFCALLLRSLLSSSSLFLCPYSFMLSSSTSSFRLSPFSFLFLLLLGRLTGHFRLTRRIRKRNSKTGNDNPRIKDVLRPGNKTDNRRRKQNGRS